MFPLLSRARKHEAEDKTSLNSVIDVHFYPEAETKEKIKLIQAEIGGVFNVAFKRTL